MYAKKATERTHEWIHAKFARLLKIKTVPNTFANIHEFTAIFWTSGGKGCLYDTAVLERGGAWTHTSSSTYEPRRHPEPCRTRRSQSPSARGPSIGNTRVAAFCSILQHFCSIFTAFLQHFCSILHFEALQDFRTWDSIFCTSGWVRSWLRIARGTLIESSPSSDAMLVPTGLEITTPNIGIPKCKDKVLQNLTN